MTDPATTQLPPPAFLAEGAAARVLAALPGSRAVGGCVRDLLASRAVHDIDIGVPLPPDRVVPLLREAGLKVFETGLQHGTVTAVAHHQPVEVTSLRQDIATDGRHAEVAWTTDWRIDAARRDFTINALSMAADGRLWDYFNGREDLAAGRVRFVGDAAQRLREDYLRALRFFRFQARYGLGAPDAEAIAAIRHAVPGLARLSAERVWMEIKRLLQAPDPTAALALMADTGVLPAVLPEASGLPVLARLVARAAPPEPLLRLAALLPQGADIAALAHRLRLSGEEASRLALLQGLAPDPAADALGLRRQRAELAGDALADRAWLAEARGTAGDWPAYRAAIAGQPKLDLPVLGRDLLALGVPPGPAIGDLLHRLRAWWIDQGCPDDRAACLVQLRTLLAQP